MHNVKQSQQVLHCCGKLHFAHTPSWVNRTADATAAADEDPRPCCSSNRANTCAGAKGNTPFLINAATTSAMLQPLGAAAAAGAALAFSAIA
jgi:hypothetical protein